MSTNTFRSYADLLFRFGHQQHDYLRRFQNYRILYGLGDSHLRVFYYIKQQQMLSKTSLRLKRVVASSAMGLPNFDSKTNARRIFEAFIASDVSPRDSLMFLLGEVDCGYVIWSRAQQHQLSVENQFERSLKHYQDFVLQVNERGYHNLILASVPLPTLRDGQDWGEVGDQRRNITATLRERTDLTFQYNQRLRQFGQQHGFQYLDFAQDLLNPETNLLDDRFRDPNPLDHHLDSVTLAPVVIRRLSELGFV